MPSSAPTAYDQLCQHARETQLLASIEDVLSWDERTQLPPAAGEYRAEQMTYLAGLVHRRRTDPRLGEWLAELAGSELAREPHSDAGTVIRQLKRQYDKLVKLPIETINGELDPCATGFRIVTSPALRSSPTSP